MDALYHAIVIIIEGIFRKRFTDAFEAQNPRNTMLLN